MKWKCRKCGKEIEREKELYSNPQLLDPLWNHLKQHKELYEAMATFENPYDITDIYLRHKHPDETINSKGEQV